MSGNKIVRLSKRHVDGGVTNGMMEEMHAEAVCEGLQSLSSQVRDQKDISCLEESSELGSKLLRAIS